MRGAKKSITLKFKDGHFWAIVMCSVQQTDVCRAYSSVKESLPETGIDPGLTAVLTDSFGNAYETPKPLKAAQAKLRHIQKDVSRKFEVRKSLHLKVLAQVREKTGSKAPVAEGLVESLRMLHYSNRLKSNIVKLGKAHTKVERIRTDVARKVARRIENRFSRIAVEEHGLAFMVRNRKLAKTATDVAIGKQKLILKSAMGKGRYFKASTQRPEGGNSQTCLCGESVPKTLKDRWHTCPACGLSAPRDQVSAIIVQHTTFGSVPEFDKSTPGLGVLEHAAKLLETRRGESDGKSSESCLAQGQRTTKSSAAVELSVKRPTQRTCLKRNTTGGAKAPSVEDKTMDHADTLGSWSIESKGRLMVGKSLILNADVSGLSQKHPPSGG